jgi:photosystem II stability/assembly factor-like uncharacterized protein
MTMRHRGLIVSVLGLLLVSPAIALAADEKKPDAEPAKPDYFKHLKYRSIGPFAGGRVSRVSGVAGDPLTYYAATSAGGVWKSSDGGTSWKPIFDDQPVSSMGSIAIADSDPNVIYVGAGEANIRGNVAAGNGIYKSTDAGKTWTHVWKQESQIGTMIAHPTNPDIAFAAVLGHAFGPNSERGVYRTQDGGKTWQRVLYKDPQTGASDVCFDPQNPRILFAGLWQAVRKPWELVSGGPGSGLYMSRDGGDTWKHLTGQGLPEGIMGKIGVRVAPSNGQRVYALIESEKGGMYRSDDGGDHWTLTSGNHSLRSRPWYFSCLTVAPRNADVVWCPEVAMLKSIDGGKTFAPAHGIHHGDHHDIWINPRDPRHMIAGNDGGVDVSHDGGASWYGPPLPICQFYHVAADNALPYHVSGCMQDLGTLQGPSDSLNSAGIGQADWHGVGGGEAGFTAPDPVDSDIVYAGEYGGYLSRYDHKTRQIQNVSIYPANPIGHGAEDLRYRFQWTAPITVSLHDHHVVYHAGNVLFKTADQGMHWQAISPDLTRNDKSKQKWSGGPITGDNTSIEYYGTIFAIAESPVSKDVLWTGSDDGLVHVTQDGGKNWKNVTSAIIGLPEWGTVNCIEASPYDAGTAYVTVEAHRLDNMKPYLWKTEDFGKTWKSLSAGLQDHVYLHAVRVDPKKKELLYVGTERSVMFSPDDGATWQSLKLNMPTVACRDLVVRNNDLVVATMGRSLWILDNLTAVRDHSPQLEIEDVHLFAIEPAFRWQRHGPSFVDTFAPNPPQGAFIQYYLKKKPKGEVTIEILDEQGKLVRKLSSKPDEDGKEASEFEGIFGAGQDDTVTVEPGLNRVAWDMHYDGAKQLKKAVTFGGTGKEGPLALPGAYKVKLTVDGKSQTKSAEIRPDPRVPATPDELKEQLAFAMKIRDDLSRLANMVNQIRGIRVQLTDRNDRLKDIPRAANLVKFSKETITKLDEVEGKLQNPKAEFVYDVLAQKGGAQLYSKLGYLYGSVTGSDGPPTQGMRDTYTEELRVLDAQQAELQSLISGQLVKLQEMARQIDLPYVIVPELASGEKKSETVQGR